MTIINICIILLKLKNQFFIKKIKKLRHETDTTNLLINDTLPGPIHSQTGKNDLLLFGKTDKPILGGLRKP